MSLDEATAAVREKIGDDCGIASRMKIDLGEDGVIFIDGTATPNVISNDDEPADVTITVSLSDYLDILSGAQNAQMAFMAGKLKLEGDMGIAMRFAQLMG
jgi:putative sterol carrier protein